MFVADTNVLLYAANASVPEHQRCREHVEQWRSSATVWYATWGILYEFLRVSTHPRVFPRPWTAPEAWRFVDSILLSSGLRILMETDLHRKVAAEVLAQSPPISGNLVFDAHTAILMREHGVSRIYTRDTDFHRFAFVEVLDPLAD